MTVTAAAPEGASRRPGRPRRSGPSTSSAATASRSGVRTAIGRELVGDAMNQSWGVMDVLAVTDFPDIRLKCAIHSANAGNILIIPREGGYLVRFYIELDNGPRQGDARQPQRHPGEAGRGREPDPAPVHRRGEGRRLVVGVRDRPAAVRQVRRRAGRGDGRPPAAGVHRRRRLPHAQRQGRPGHERVHGRHLEPRLEAGRRAARDGQAGAAAHLLRRSGRRSPSSSSTSTASSPRCSARTRPSPASAEGVDPEEFQQYFITQGRFTAGVATRYEPSMITAGADVPAPRRGLPGRDALPLRPGRPAGRRQAGPPRARRAGRRRLAALRLRRPQRPDGRGLPLPAAVRVPGVGRVADHSASPRRAPTRTR